MLSQWRPLGQWNRYLLAAGSDHSWGFESRAVEHGHQRLHFLLSLCASLAKLHPPMGTTWLVLEAALAHGNGVAAPHATFVIGVTFMVARGRLLKCALACLVGLDVRVALHLGM